VNAYAKSRELNLTGSDAEIVAVLQTLGARDVETRDVATWMRERGLWVVLPDGHAGTLYDLYRTTEDAQIKAGLGEWYASTIGGQAGMIRVTWPEIAQRVSLVAGLIAVAIPDGATLRDQFYELCGGRPYSELTVEQFAAERVAAETPAVDPEWTDTAVLLSVNLSPQSKSVTLRVSRCAVVDGRVVNGPVISTLATAKGVGDPRLTALLAEVLKLAEGLRNG
jgi:hypothetical protein